MTSFVTPRSQLWTQHNTSNSLGQVDLTFLDVRAFFHKLICLDSLENLLEDGVYTCD